MIRLTRFRGEALWLNPEWIEAVEASPDTLVRLANGREYIVAEAPERIRELYWTYRRETGGRRGGEVLGAAVRRGTESSDGEPEGD